MNKVNYNLEYNKIVKTILSEGIRPKLLLHACCAPCSSACMDKLRAIFDITVFFYNPNITLREEYDKRVEELHRLIDVYNDTGVGFEDKWLGHYWIAENAKAAILEGVSSRSDEYLIKVIDGAYESDRFYEISKGLEEEPERGMRCHACYALRIKESAKVAKDIGADYFTTTLTLSPLKDEQILNQTGIRIAESMAGPLWLPTDFKKEGGYQRSIELSKKYELYRQNFCGCEYSKTK